MDDNTHSRRDLETRLIERALKDEAFAEELRRNPRAAVEREVGALPEGMDVKVLQEDEHTFYLVLPAPEETGEFVLSEEDLASISGGSTINSCCSCTGTNWPKTN